MSQLKPGETLIHGKVYKGVALRVAELRADHPDWGIHTELVESGDNVIVKAIVTNDDGNVIGSGYAEEVRGSTNINKTSALENCETSAIGRALSACGYGGENYASANEVTDAILQQKTAEISDKWVNHMAKLKEILPSVLAFKEALAQDDQSTAFEVYDELTEEERKTIYNPAPSKGGILTTAERGFIGSNEMAALRKEKYGLTE